MLPFLSNQPWEKANQTVVNVKCPSIDGLGNVLMLYTNNVWGETYWTMRC